VANSILPKLSRDKEVVAVAATSWFAQQSAQSLVVSYDQSKTEVRLFARDYDIKLLLAYQLATQSQDPIQLAAVGAAVRATLGNLTVTEPSALAQMVTVDGSADSTNIVMRDACLHLAMLYGITHDVSMANRSAALLARFAAVIPEWPIWTPYYEAPDRKVAASQSTPETFKSIYAAGLWGQWIYMDLAMGTPLLQANAIVQPSGATAALNADLAIRRMFELHIATQRKFSSGPMFSNMDAFPIRGFMDFGAMMPDPALVHEGVRWMDALYRVGFYADGWWHEGSTSYHYDLQYGLRWVANDCLKGYSDPVGFVDPIDGRHFDNIDLGVMFAEQMADTEGVIRRQVLPDGNLLAVHESVWPSPAPLSASMSAIGGSNLFGVTGQGTVASGSGLLSSLATLHWGGSNGSHAHADALNLNLWSNGVEAISENQYRILAGSNTTREWNRSTAAHCTVVVDQKSQAAIGPRLDRRRIKHAEDAVEGVSDWPYRWGNAAIDDSGALRLYNTDFSKVQVIEAEAEHSYDAISNVSLYRRTIALVHIEGDDYYVADVFRVRGGSLHDYMLHSCLQSSSALSVSVPMQAKAGTLHGLLSNLRSGATDGGWASRFEIDGGKTLNSFVCGAPNTEVIIGDGPSMRTVSSAPFVMVRRTTGDSTFIVVHHVSGAGGSRVQGVEQVSTDSPDCVAFRVTLDGRTDTIISNIDRNTAHEVDGAIHVRGAFAHVAQSSALSNNWTYLVDGDLLNDGRVAISGEVSAAGSVGSTSRTMSGDSCNALQLVTSNTLDSSFEGAPIIVDQAGSAQWSYRVVHASGSTVEVPHDPGFVVSAGMVKQVRFPCWGFVGSAGFRIPGHALVRWTHSGGWDFAHTGSASANNSGTIATSTP
jgi:hypothetical protein